jgi:hypothetical protein
MKKIFALLTIITFLVAGTAFAGGKKKEPPPKSDIEIQVLQPAPDSEVILDEVLLIKSKHEQGDLIKWEYNVPHDESEADIEVIVDREKGTYKATKGPVSEEVKSRAGDLPPEMMERFRELYRQRESEQECNVSHYSDPKISQSTDSFKIG